MYSIFNVNGQVGGGGDVILFFGSLNNRLFK
jgi:hypothetical protein